MGKFIIQDPTFVSDVREALEQGNPNDPATEIWDEEAIEQLAAYLVANEFGPIDTILNDQLYDQLYFLYDLIKWTSANK